MHSNDFGFREQIDGKSKKEWETEFGILGFLAHMEGLGWSTYQWRYRSLDEAKTDKPSPFERKACFVEFFSPYYHGYLRGDGDTVRAAVERCVAVAQRYAQCERKLGGGHEYVPFRMGKNGQEYDNGLLMCRHCGFAGYTSLVESLQKTIEHYEIALQNSQERAAEFINAFKERGKTPEEIFQESLVSVIDALGEKNGEAGNSGSNADTDGTSRDEPTGSGAVGES